MVKVIWTIDSIDDMNDIGDLIAQSHPDYAAFLISEFMKCESILGKFPRIGHVMPEAQIPSIRQLILHGYRIIYFYDDELFVVKILRVQHSSKPLSPGIRN